jgi:transcription-repair coupling factor (superfamily II helicase)
MELSCDRLVNDIIRRLAAVGGVVKVAGTWGSFARLLTAHLSRQLNRPIILICLHIDDADNAIDDLQTFGALVSAKAELNPQLEGTELSKSKSIRELTCRAVAGKDVMQLPAWEGEEDIADATDEIRAERLKAVTCHKGKNTIIAASVQAISQSIPTPESIEQSTLNLETGRNISPEKITDWLVDNGFERTDKIDLPGQFARRGGIIDIFAPLADFDLDSRVRGNDKITEQAQALRVEFFGDTIESIRQIDLDTQRSTNEIKAVQMVSVICGQKAEQRELFLNILSPDTIVIIEEPADCQEVAKVYYERAESKDRLYDWAQINKALERFTQIHIARFAVGDPAEYIKLDIRSIQQYQHKQSLVWAGHKESLAELVSEAKKGKLVYICCEAEAEIDRLSEIIKQEHTEIPSHLKLLKGFVHQGFAMPSLNTIIIAHHELFGQFALRRRIRPMKPTAPIDTLEDLQPGDYVVHASYGIGKFLGIETIKEKTGSNEYLTI